MFRSTPPREGRRDQVSVLAADILVSIHAPA